jgi:hypothetical protein
MGTYNFVVPGTIRGDIGHGVYDVAPYLLWGNSEADPTTVWGRVKMSLPKSGEEKEK